MSQDGPHVCLQDWTPTLSQDTILGQEPMCRSLRDHRQPQGFEVSVCPLTGVFSSTH